MVYYQAVKWPMYPGTSLQVALYILLKINTLPPMDAPVCFVHEKKLFLTAGTNRLGHDLCRDVVRFPASRNDRAAVQTLRRRFLLLRGALILLIVGVTPNRARPHVTDICSCDQVGTQVRIQARDVVVQIGKPAISLNPRM